MFKWKLIKKIEQYINWEYREEKPSFVRPQFEKEMYQNATEDCCTEEFVEPSVEQAIHQVQSAPPPVAPNIQHKFLQAPEKN